MEKEEMTHRDETRKKCIQQIHGTFIGLGFDATIEEATAIFDSLHGIATVTLPEATDEMMQAWINAIRSDPKSCMNAALAAGNLTNPPEKPE